MKKYLSVLFIIALLVPFIYSGEKIVEMSRLNKPATIIVDGGQILIAEFPTIYVYSQKDASFITSFGKQGEGPREFSQYTRIQKDPKNPDKIVVGSHMKISYFTRDGKFITEKRPKGSTQANVYKPFGEKYVSYGQYQDQKSKTNFQTIILYDKDMKKIKNIYEEKGTFQQGRKINVLRSWGAWFRIWKDKVFVTGEKEGYVLMYDENGNLTKELKCELGELKVRDSDKKRYREFLRTDPQFKRFYDVIKEFVDFPAVFPIIRGMEVVDDKLYVNGYPHPDGRTEFAIYTLDGKLIKNKIYLPVPEATARDLYPYTIKDDKLYQLVDNDDEEVWELHIHDLK